MLTIEPHPLLDASVFVTEFPHALNDLTLEVDVAPWLRLDADAPLHATDAVRAAVRDLLRHGGFKPTGRNKPAAEYLRKAAEEGSLHSINPAVDICNIVSLHSGLPISLVDLDRAQSPFRIAIAPPTTEYVFNPSGQVIRLDGLVCLWDAEGPCANAVKDAQRSKTTDLTRRTLTVIWGTNALPGYAAQAENWYHQLLSLYRARVRPPDHPA